MFNNISASAHGFNTNIKYYSTQTKESLIE